MTLKLGNSYNSSTSTELSQQVEIITLKRLVREMAILTEHIADDTAMDYRKFVQSADGLPTCAFCGVDNKVHTKNCAVWIARELLSRPEIQAIIKEVEGASR